MKFGSVVHKLWFKNMAINGGSTQKYEENIDGCEESLEGKNNLQEKPSTDKSAHSKS